MVDGGGSHRCALLGDNIAEMGYKNGWSVSHPSLPRAPHCCDTQASAGAHNSSTRQHMLKTLLIASASKCCNNTESSWKSDTCYRGLLS